MPSFNVKIQKADGTTKNLIVESKSPLNAKKFLRRHGLKPIEVQISKSNTPSGTQPRERDYIATCELRNGTKTTIKITVVNEITARRELRRIGKRVIKLEPAPRQTRAANTNTKEATTSIINESKNKSEIAHKSHQPWNPLNGSSNGLQESRRKPSGQANSQRLWMQEFQSFEDWT